MKTRLLLILGLCLATRLYAQAQASGDASAPKRSSDELAELLGPVALYPDPLISLILPAASVPSDIVLADRFVGGGGDPAAADDKPWDSSVKALTHYPDTLKWLDDNLDWTTQVGDAFVNQPVDVMEAIQALRAKAQAQGNLVDTPEEKVVQDDDSIRIVPADPDAIYVPTYDPEVVYVHRAPVVVFGVACVVGPWLAYDFDWHHHHIFWGEWHHGWDYSHGHDREVFLESRMKTTRVWHVDPKRRLLEVRHPAAVHVAGGGHIAVPHPKPLVIAPHKGESIRRAEVKVPGKGEVIKGHEGKVEEHKGKVEEHKGKVEEHKGKVEEHKAKEEEHKAEEHKGNAKVFKADEHKAREEEHKGHEEAKKGHEEVHKGHEEVHKEGGKKDDKKKVP